MFLQFQEAVKHCLYTAEAADYVHPNLGISADKDQPCTLLGLTKELLNRANPHNKVIILIILLASVT